jgi:hypothetical protein
MRLGSGHQLAPLSYIDQILDDAFSLQDVSGRGASFGALEENSPLAHFGFLFYCTFAGAQAFATVTA